MIELLSTIAEEMEKLNINYDYGLYKKTPIEYPYMVGKYFPSDFRYEDMTTEGEFLLEAWDRNLSFLNLVELDNKIKKHFGDFKTIKNNVGISISYFISSLEDSEDGELKKLQIRLEFSYWEGE